MTGKPIAVHQPQCHNGLGIRTLNVSPNEKLIGCGLYDTNLSLYNNLSQVQICELDHMESLNLTEENGPIVFKEEMIK